MPKPIKIGMPGNQTVKSHYIPPKNSIFFVSSSFALLTNLSRIEIDDSKAEEFDAKDNNTSWDFWEEEE